MAIHPTAIIDPKAELDSSVEVGPYCVIDAHVRVARGCRLYHGVYLTGWTEIGEDCVLHPGAIVGHAPQDTKYGGERSFCRIGPRTILREHVTIHRGTDPDSATTVGENCFLLAGAHVAHNCVVGSDVTLVNNVLLGGHVHVQDLVTIGGGAVVHQFVRIGKLAMITGNARITMDILPFALVDVTGHIAGLNRVGLRRADVSPEDRDDLRKAYRLLFSSGLPFQQAVGELGKSAHTSCGQHLVRFLCEKTRRGFAGRVRTSGVGRAVACSQRTMDE